MANMKEATAKYEELKKDLASVFEKLGNRAQAFNVEDAEASNFMNKLDMMRAIISEVTAQQDKVEELTKVGNELLSILDALDCKDTPKGKDIQNTVANVPARFVNLKEISAHKQNLLDERAIRFSQEWLVIAKERLDVKELVSLDRDVLNEQITSYRSLLADLDQHATLIRSVLDRSVPLLVEKCNGIASEFDTLRSQAEQRGLGLESAVEKLETFHLSVYQLESWYAYANQSIKQESMDLAFSLNKIDMMFKQRNEKQSQLDDVRSVSKGLLEDPQYGDKDKLKDNLQQLGNKWEEVTTNLSKRISSNVALEMRELTKYLEKFTSDLDNADPISGDVETVAKQYTDHQTTHDAMKKKHKAVLDKVNKYKALHKSLTRKDIGGTVQSGWTAAHKDALAVSKRSEERLAQLEEAQPAQMSAEINIDEILENWIELDALKDEADKKKSNEKSGKDKSSAEKSPKPAGKSSGTTSSSKTAVKSNNSNSSKSKKESSSSKSVKDAASKSTKVSSADSTKSTDSSSKSKKNAAASIAKQSSKDNTTKQTKSDTSASNIKSEDHVDSKSATAEKVPVIVLPEKKNQDTKLRHGVMLSNLKESVSQTDIHEFLKPVVPKVVEVMFYKKSPEEGRRSIITVSSSTEAEDIVKKLNKSTFQGLNVSIQRVEVQRKGSQGKSKSIFDKPARGDSKDKEAKKKKVPTATLR